MDQYYTKTAETPVYIAALVLDPRKKWSYFEQNWIEHPDWIKDAMEKMQQFWDEHYKSTETVISNPALKSILKLNTFQA